jgi:hypothetical protein
LIRLAGVTAIHTVRKGSEEGAVTVTARTAWKRAYIIAIAAVVQGADSSAFAAAASVIIIACIAALSTVVFVFCQIRTAFVTADALFTARLFIAGRIFTILVPVAVIIYSIVAGDFFVFSLTYASPLRTHSPEVVTQLAFTLGIRAVKPDADIFVPGVRYARCVRYTRSVWNVRGIRSGVRSAGGIRSSAAIHYRCIARSASSVDALLVVLTITILETLGSLGTTVDCSPCTDCQKSCSHTDEPQKMACAHFNNSTNPGWPHANVASERLNVSERLFTENRIGVPLKEETSGF